MGRLIDADAFDKRIRLAVGSCEEELTEDFKDGISTILEMMKTAPTVDAVPVKHGRWECSDHYENAVCSECGYDTGEAWGFGHGRGCYNFCPNCGADMRKDGDADGV